jgi:hypothetical protein
MIPPRNFPEGNLKLVEISPKGEKLILQESGNSTVQRTRMQELRHDLLMSDPTRNLVIQENNAPI